MENFLSFFEKRSIRIVLLLIYFMLVFSYVDFSSIFPYFSKISEYSRNDIFFLTLVIIMTALFGWLIASENSRDLVGFFFYGIYFIVFAATLYVGDAEGLFYPLTFFALFEISSNLSSLYYS